MTNSTVVQLKTSDGHSLDVELQPPANTDSFYLFSIHKAGSTLLNSMMQVVCDRLGIPVFAPEVIEFDNGLKIGTLTDSVKEILQLRGYCFGGFRGWHRYLDGLDLSSIHKVFLIRDPRDMLVSHYFSHKFSHPIPPGELGKRMQQFRASLDAKGIDDYVLERAPMVLQRLKKLETNVVDDHCKLYRYEDVVFEKQSWLADMLDFVGLEMGQSECEEIAGFFNTLPEKENPAEHVRKVTPGDHRDKLQPETIKELNHIFVDVLERYQYTSE